uniref:Histone chaperone n=1 Tax=Panagrellus redivivus TaxID=6233 RepID=A0A7E4W3Z4_PANRE
MSAPLVITSMEFLNNPAKWTDGYQVQITFEAHEDLDKDVEWQLIYVASPTDETNDQILEEVAIGPIAKGRHQFVLEAPAPDPAKIKDADYIHDITLLLLKCFYAEKMFTKVGWFVTNEYEDPELQAAKPKVPQVDKLKRQIQIKDVRVTQFPNAWREEEPPVVPGADEDSEIAFNTADPLPEDDDDDLDDDDVREENAEVDGDIELDNTMEVDENSEKLKDVVLADEKVAAIEGGAGDALVEQN